MKLMKLLYSPGPIIEKSVMKFGKIQYLGNTSTKVGKQLNKYGIRPAYYSKGTIGSLLVNNKLDKFDKNCGVYELQCGKCNISYIVQRGRTFLISSKNTPISVKKEVGDEGLSSSLANLNTGHDVTISDLSVLCEEQIGHKLDTLEISEIARPTLLAKPY
jgi:hypothetical protein